MRDYAIQLATQINNIGDIAYTFIVNKNQSTFSISVNAGWSSTLLFNTGPNKRFSCHNQLGFNDSQDYEIAGDNSIHSTKITMMYDILSLSLKLDIVNNVVISNDNVDNVLTTIPVNAPFGIVSYQNSDDSRRYLLSEKYINMLKVSELIIIIIY